MKFEVKGRIAIFQNDAILGLTDDQAFKRKHQLEALGHGNYRVIGPNVKFSFREIVDIVDGPAALTAQKDEAGKLGIRFGLGVGTKTLAARIDEVKAAKAAYEKKADDGIERLRDKARELGKAAARARVKRKPAK